MTSERDGEFTDVDADSRAPTLEAQWKSVPSDPDPEDHLGYEWIPLEVLGADGADQLMLLPTDEELLRQDAFAVLDSATIEDLGGWQ